MAMVGRLGSIAEEVGTFGMSEVGMSGGEDVDEVCSGMITIIRAVGVHPKLVDILAAVLVCLFVCMFACVSVLGLGWCGGCS